MTTADKENLKNCPTDKWFTDIDVFPKIKRGRYSLGRLVDAGYLEWRFENNERQYKRTDKAV